MKKKAVFTYILPMLAVVFVLTAWFGTRQATAAVQKLEELEAIYTGEPVQVGAQISLKDISLTAKYYVSEGEYGYDDYETVKKGFTITPSVIKAKGENKVVVSYKGKTCVVSVEGKAVESITASYTGEAVYVGAAVPTGKIEVYAYFSDGSYERVKTFTLSVPTVQKEGMNMISVVYEGKTDIIYVEGKAPLAVEEIYASYIGEPVIVGNSISKGKIEVQALYNDGTLKTITNFNISPSIVEDEGENDIVVSYGEVSTVIQVYGEERYITEMRARYTGPGVIVGKSVPRDEIEVIVTYNDGLDEELDSYELFGEEILFEGENVVLVYCDSFMEEITVYGVAGFAANYDNSISNYFTSEDGYYYTEVTLGMNMGLSADKFFLLKADEEQAESMVQRVVFTEDFIAFQLFYDDDEMVREFPMAMKVTVPDGFDAEKFGVYYTPAQSTTMAKVDGYFLDEEQKEYEFIVYEPGMYILVNEVSNLLVSEIIVETKVVLRENRSYSLNPVVFPLSAENREVSYESTDETVATVSANGKIRTYNEGTCEIWIEAEDNSGVYAVVTVVVKNKK